MNEENPQEFKITQDVPSAGRRLTKLPILIGGAFLVFGVFFVIYQITQKAETEKTKKIENNNTSHIKSRDINSTINDLEKFSRFKYDTNNSKPLLVGGSNIQDYNVTMPEQKNTPLDDAAQKAAADQLQRAIEAKNSPTALDNSKNQTGSGANIAEIGNILSNVLKPNQMQSPGEKSLAEILAAGTSQKASVNQESNSFMTSTQNSYDYLPFKKTPQISKYELKTGSVIPAVMISGINSELPGMLIGQVSQNVYDSATGHYLLIPQGSRLVGQYSADVQYGQSRVLVAWNRIIFPDGQSLNIGAMNGTDQAGYAGFEDKVNNHYMKIFGSALLISIIGGEISFTNGSFSLNQQAQSANNSGTTISQVGNTMLEKNLGISPTIEIRPGYQFNIFVTKDIQLEALKRYRG
ncbi:TrbI/VirB10 family protein [Aquamicrobium sp.]|uniref:TrbI/VirB10 family protein n=1 Tax=Aquamicrobium sp. TaxID=1872579 RepID=UPI0025869492|nr:TrbI/VirB10 family protein [Aquamicrobium sp.]MCK9550435.1 hypothetical protein [Aquamicrobium sp.]